MSGRRGPGCCGGCGGDGVDPTAYESNGQCWDCHGTGHAHDGWCRSRFLDWFHAHSLGVIQALIAWLLLAGIVMIALAVQDYVWPAYAFAAVSGAWWFGWLVLDLAADRQIGRYGPPPARGGHHA